MKEGIFVDISSLKKCSIFYDIHDGFVVEMETYDGDITYKIPSPQKFMEFVDFLFRKFGKNSSRISISGDIKVMIDFYNLVVNNWRSLRFPIVLKAKIKDFHFRGFLRDLISDYFDKWGYSGVDVNYYFDEDADTADVVVFYVENVSE